MDGAGALGRRPGGNRRAALKASGDLRRALEDAGATVELIPPVAGLPDLVFPANAAVVLDGKVLLARFRHPERAGEEPHFRRAFERLDARGLLREVAPDGVFQEGAGDCHLGRRAAAVLGRQRPALHPQRPARSPPIFGQQMVHLPLATPSASTTWTPASAR